MRPKLALSRLGWLASAALWCGCSGEVIRLGDGPLGISAAGTGGAAGNAVAGAGGTSSGGTGGQSMTAGEPATGGGTAACASEQVLANEVVWIGDSWIILPGTQHTRLTELARAAGTLGPDEDYSFDLPNCAAGMGGVAQQYAMAQSGATKI